MNKFMTTFRKDQNIDDRRSSIKSRACAMQARNDNTRWQRETTGNAGLLSSIFHEIRISILWKMCSRFLRSDRSWGYSIYV